MATIYSVLIGLGILAVPIFSGAETLLSTMPTFSVSAQIVAGCSVKNGESITDLNFGTIDFGAYPSIQAGAIDGVTSDSLLQLECSPGTNLFVTLDGGSHATGGNTQRNLGNAGGALIGYQLYADAAHTKLFAVGQPVPIQASGLIELPIYGSLILPGGSTPTGVYTDTAQVTLSY